MWPLRTERRVMPDDVGRFGAQRRLDVHTGVDLYCEPNTEVVAVEAGTVRVIEWFTGQHALTGEGEVTSWWNDTLVRQPRG